MGDQLFEEWQVYEKLVIHDYMDHRAFFARLQAEVSARFSRPVAILDLGCGDAAPILPLLEGVAVSRYVGIDESDIALALAAKRLEVLRIPTRLVRGDLLDVLGGMDPSLALDGFDIILASYSMHHFADPRDKQRILEAGRRVLKPDGLFAMIDVFCLDAEPRAHYLERWVGNAENRYLECGPVERKILFDHVRARDFPVSLNELRELGAQIGLGEFRVLLEDREGLNRLVVLAPDRAVAELPPRAFERENIAKIAKGPQIP